MKSYSQDSLQNFNKQSLQINITGMKILDAWGIANIGVGTVGWASANGTQKYFYQMNTFWGIVNTGIAYFGFQSAKRKMATNLTASEILKAQQKTETIFLINSGLDLAYIGTGAYLQNRGNNRSDEKLKGYGSSVILQGIFLAAFDAVMYKLQRDHGKKLKMFMDKKRVASDIN